MEFLKMKAKAHRRTQKYIMGLLFLITLYWYYLLVHN